MNINIHKYPQFEDLNSNLSAGVDEEGEGGQKRAKALVGFLKISPSPYLLLIYIYILNLG